MEYRGYDSVGFALLTSDGMVVRKGVGNVDTVRREKKVEELIGSMGIGHTRWATHGVVNETNAHPHTSCDSSIAVVHNGIVDNYLELKSMLISKGHIFKSDTDSEVIVHALEDLLRSRDIKCAILELIKLLKGSYAFVALLADGMIVGARSNEPLIIGVDYNGRVPYFIASDVLAFIRHTEKALFLSNEEFFILHRSKNSRKRKYTLSIYDSNGERVKRGLTDIAWEFSSLDKGKYAHYTHKEIHEQIHTVARAFNVEVSDEFIRTIMNARRIIVTGSGSSYHAALYAKYILSRIGLNIDAIVASDVKYSSIGSSDVLLAVSQSGETADTLSAVRYARSKGCPILGVVNVTTSSLARSSDMYIGIDAGIERGVAATKSFTSQLVLMYRLACIISGKDHISRSSVKALIDGISSILAGEYHASRVADRLKDLNDVYIIGKDIGYVIALEGALKLKELAYMHAEAIHASEFKHGPLALIDKNSIVIALNARDYTYEDTMNSIREVKSRGAYVIGVSDCSSEYYDHYLAIPSHDVDITYILYECIQLQLLAYHTAVKKNFNPDYPRNIAKSITVS